MYEIDFDDFQDAFAQGAITLEQFISVLIDNFGFENTRKILEKNLDLALDGTNRQHLI